MKIFGGNASIQITQEIAESLHTTPSSVDVHVFPDGERRIRIAESVVDTECVVVQSACPPVDTNYMELFFLIDALKRSGAKAVTAVVPYFGYQRQDHVFRDGEAVSLEVVIHILENLRINRLISIDMHTSKIPSLFTIPVSHLSALPLFGKHIQEKEWVTEETVLVSPDMGGIGRIKKLSSLLDNMPYAAIDKKRDLETGALLMSSFGEGSVDGKKRAIMVDDMISSGQTITLAASFLKGLGVEEVIVFATHAVFSEDASLLLQRSQIDSVFVTDTVAISKEKQCEKLSVISVAQLIASALENPVDSNNPLLSL